MAPGARGGIAGLEEKGMIPIAIGGPPRILRNNLKLPGWRDDPLRVDILRTRFAIINALLILLNVVAFLHEVTLSPKGARACLHFRAYSGA